MLPLLVVTVLTLAPAASVGTDTTFTVLGQPLEAATNVSAAGVDLFVRSPAGWQLVSVASSCVPDLEAECDTVINCQDGTANCYVTRQPRPPFPCHRPDPQGPLICDFNQTEPGEPAPVVQPPACGDALSPGACALVPEAGEDLTSACQRYFAASACARLPAAPEAPQADPAAALPRGLRCPRLRGHHRLIPRPRGVAGRMPEGFLRRSPAADSGPRPVVHQVPSAIGSVV